MVPAAVASQEVNYSFIKQLFNYRIRILMYAPYDSLLGLTHGFAKRANAARTGTFSLVTKVLSKPIRALLQFKCVIPIYLAF